VLPEASCAPGPPTANARYDGPHNGRPGSGSLKTLHWDKYNIGVILAGDVGGTKTLLGLFDFAPQRPVAVDVRTFPTAEYGDLPAIIGAFLAHGSAPPIRAGCFGVAGPVVDQVAHLTNVPWVVSAEKLTRKFGVPHVRLLNDLEAMAYAVPVAAARRTAHAAGGREPTWWERRAHRGRHRAGRIGAASPRRPLQATRH
jgi:hypothetical protein